MSKTILDSVAEKAGGYKELGCKVGKSYATLKNYSSLNKDNFPAITAYGVQKAVELFEITGKSENYLGIDGNVLVEFKIEKR